MPYKDPEKVKEQQKKYSKEWRKKNKEKKQEYDKKYREEHKDKIKEYNKKRYKKNKEKMQEYFKKYSEENKEKRHEYMKETMGGNYKNPTINDEFVKIFEVYGKIFEGRLFNNKTNRRNIHTLSAVLSCKPKIDGGFLSLLKLLKIEVIKQDKCDYIKQSDIPKIQEFLANHMTTADVTNRYSINFKKMYDLRESGRLKFKKIGHYCWYRIDDIINLDKSGWK